MAYLLRSYVPLGPSKMVFGCSQEGARHEFLARVALPDGTTAARAGCAVLGAPPVVERLVGHFLKALDAGSG